MRWYELAKYAQYKTKQKPLQSKLGAAQIQQEAWVQSPRLPLRRGYQPYNTISTSISQAERCRPIRARFWGDTNIHIHKSQAHHGIKIHTATFKTFSLNDQAYNAAQAFKRSGLITEAHGGCRMQFPMGLMRGISGIKLFTAPISTQSSEQSAVTFDTFLLVTFERMRASALRQSLSRQSPNSSRLMEREWQHIWCGAANTAVPLGNLIITVAGPVYGSPNYLDFYIGGTLQWGVEIITEGIRTGGRTAHCAGRGESVNIPINHWAIIDFRHHSAVPKELKPHVWYAMYPDDYKTFTVRRQGHEDKVIRLCGDFHISPIGVFGDQF